MRKFSVFSWLVVLLVGISFSAADASNERLVDLLLSKQLITTEDASEYRADVSLQAQEAQENQKEFAVIAGKAVKLSGYTQFRYRNDANATGNFDIRRARLDIKGDITEKFDFDTLIDFGGQKGVALLDSTIGYKLNNNTKLLAGQFKIPFSRENLASDAKSEFLNRSQVGEALTARSTDVIGNQNGRDTGVQVAGNFLNADDSNFVDYSVAVLNGAGINKLDVSKQTDLAGRVVYYPNSNWSVGLSGYSGTYPISSTSTENARMRTGYEFTYTEDLLSVKGEYLKGNDGLKYRLGWYLQTGYYVLPNTLQAVLRYDTYDPDEQKSLDEVDITTVGTNWYLDKSALVQVNYEMKEERDNKINNNVLTGQLTVLF